MYKRCTSPELHPECPAVPQFSTLPFALLWKSSHWEMDVSRAQQSITQGSSEAMGLPSAWEWSGIKH